MKVKIKKALFKYGSIVRQCKLYNGQNFLVTNKDKGLSKDIFVYGIREENALKYFLECLGSKDIVLDVGANIGFYVVQEALIASKVIGIEPVKQNYYFLGLNKLLNNLANVNTFELAIGEKTGFSDFYESEFGNLSTVVFREETHNYTKTKVQMFTGKDFLELFDIKANVLRMDVEGYELEILKSFKERLKEFNKIFLEVHAVYLKEKEEEVFDVLKEAKFDLFWYVPDEKLHGKFEKQVFNLKELKDYKREDVYHLFCFKGGLK